MLTVLLYLAIVGAAVGALTLLPLPPDDYLTENPRKEIR